MNRPLARGPLAPGLILAALALGGAGLIAEGGMPVDMVTILPRGAEAAFMMGSGDCFSADGEVFDDQGPVHGVVLTRPYALARFETTNAQYCAAMNREISAGRAKLSGGDLWDGSGKFLLLGIAHADMGPQEGIRIAEGRLEVKEAGGLSMADHPVACVSWYGAVAFCGALSNEEGLEACYGPDWACEPQRFGYRLPTEAEWEYAARGDTSRSYAWGDEPPNRRCTYGGLKPLGAWTTPVGFWDGGLKRGIETLDGSSPFGLHDMSGNVWEWCQDWYGRRYFASSPERDPAGPAQGDIRRPWNAAPGRVWRGGGNRAPAETYLRLGTRYSWKPEGCLGELGFRVARTLE